MKATSGAMFQGRLKRMSGTVALARSMFISEDAKPAG
jgi:hypothetical protein